MPTLDWIGKNAVANHHNEVPYRLIHCDGNLSAGDAASGNLLVQGDNLEALKALLPYYRGQVKCIYIDPPYNTGNENWVYNDNVNSPEIRAWLDKVVGKEGEDLSRHDKWLCMMYPRLKLLKKFLRDDGVIFVSIDDNELGNLLQSLREIFQFNHLATLVWVNEGNINNQAKIKNNHEYILCFAKSKDRFQFPRLIDPNIEESSKLANKYIENTVVKNGFKNPISDIHLPVGFPANFKQGVIQPINKEDVWPKFSQPIQVHNFCLATATSVRSGWSSKALCEAFIENQFNDVIDRKGQWTRFFLTEGGAIYSQKDRTDFQSHVLSVLHNMGSVQGSADELEGMQIHFPYPKPKKLLCYLFKILNLNNDLILDSFAGSGTTGHAVLDLNKQDGGNRKFILVEMDKNISKDVTAQRLTKIIDGYNKGGDPSKPVAGLGGGFRFCKLGDPLFDEMGYISTSVSFSDLAAHVFFVETGTPIPARASSASPLIGTFNNVAIYLLFAPASLGQQNIDIGNVLTPKILDDMLASRNASDTSFVIYAEGCTVSEDRLKAANVTFKQIPYTVAGA